jgi:SSS family solute:Na+ symporter
MPEFLERRYSTSVRTVMAIFWLGVYVFINLTAILWLGATAVHTVAGVEVQTALIALALFAGAYALYGGLKAVALTDIVQVSLLVLGGLIISFIALNKISGLRESSPAFMSDHAISRKFKMILPPGSPYYKGSSGSIRPARRDVGDESRTGDSTNTSFSGRWRKAFGKRRRASCSLPFLKLLMPVIIVLPGICRGPGAESRAAG